MTVNDLFPAKYLKAEDFAEGETKIFTIKNYEVEEMGQGKDKQNKPVIYFREPDAKPLVLNKTNASIIAKYYKEDLDEWIGKKVALYAIEVESFGDIVRAIRVKTKQPNGNTPAPRPAPEPELFGPDDDHQDVTPGPDALPDMHLQPGGVPIPSKKKSA